MCLGRYWLTRSDHGLVVEDVLVKMLVVAKVNFKKFDRQTFSCRRKVLPSRDSTVIQNGLCTYMYCKHDPTPYLSSSCPKTSS